MNANLDIKFLNGIGHLSAIVFRNKVVVSKGELRRSGTITLNDIESGDSVSIDGVNSGTTHLEIDVPIDPAPQTRDYPEGDIFDQFDIV